MCKGFVPRARKSPSRLCHRLTRKAATPIIEDEANGKLPIAASTVYPPEVENAPRSLRAEARGKFRKQQKKKGNSALTKKRRRKQAASTA